jgi:beta-glucanase (GH16 family)
MKKFLAIALLVLILASCSPKTAISLGVSGAVQVFSDDFSTGMSPVWYKNAIWYGCSNGGRTDQGVNAKAWFMCSQVTAPGDGYLHLTAKKHLIGEAGLTTYPYWSGYTQTGGYTGSSSQPKQWFTYGYFEARMKCPQMNGAWCAFWLWADPNSSNEIDITETLGNAPYISNINLHGATIFSREYTMPSPNYEWHTYAVDWQPGYIKWYVDNVLAATYTGTDFNNKSLYIILSYQLGGDWAGPVDESKLPNEMLIDYVSVWQTAGNTPTATVVPPTKTRTPTTYFIPTNTRTATKTNTPIAPTFTPGVVISECYEIWFKNIQKYVTICIP